MSKENLFKNLGKYLREKRVESGMSQGAVADKLGYESPQFISNIERGLCAPPMNKLKVMVDLYDMPAQEVLELILREQRKVMTQQLMGRSKRA